MLFSEIYGKYYQTVAAILREAVNGDLTRKKLNRIVQDRAFGESLLTIPEALTSGQWPLLDSDMETPLEAPPQTPLTALQKRWLKALLLDPKIRLFDVDDTGLKDVEPLFRPEWLVYYDRYTDGDDFDDPEYIRRFQIIREALKEQKQLEITFRDAKGNHHHTKVSPQYLEYSEKDDRFRLAAEGFRAWTINLSRIEDCRLLNDAAYTTGQVLRNTQTVTMVLTDERNALERVLLHFSHLEKETEKLDDMHYRIILHYDENDAAELLIRILSFGPVLEVIEPEAFKERIRDRLQKQSFY